MVDGTVRAHWHLTSDVVCMTEVFDTMDEKAIQEQQQRVKLIMKVSLRNSLLLKLRSQYATLACTIV